MEESRCFFGEISFVGQLFQPAIVPEDYAISKSDLHLSDGDIDIYVHNDC